MFTLQDGRQHLYQWDLDRYIIVNDANICEVHFCNRTSDCSLVVEVKDGLAAIPNILLQDARPIRAYAYCDDKYTLTESQFTVKSRTKPADYVYTETETVQFSTISHRMDNLEATIPQTVADEVNNYIAENDIFYTKDETDLLLDNVYTKEETDAAIYNSKDAYYIRIEDLAEGEENAVKASDELQEFANRLVVDRNVCLHFYDTKLVGGYAQTGFVTASISVRTKHIQFRASNIDAILVSKDAPVALVIYHLDLNDNNEWMFYRESSGGLNLATKEYVTQAIADSAQGEVDLSNYYTKEEVNALFNGIATAEGGSY